MLPVTIEELIFEEIGSENIPDALVLPDHLEVKALSNVGVRLGFLRSMDIIYLYHPMPEFKTLLECPNLKRLCVRWSESPPWDLPLWVPASLSELELRVRAESRIPDFGAAIRPSVVTIDFSAGFPGFPVSYLQSSTWIKKCINSLPFPRSIQVLTVSILNQQSIADDGMDGLYPELSDYEMLSSFLQQLRVCERGNLEKIILSVTTEVEPTDDVEWQVDGEAQELAKLKNVFAELLEAKALDVDFTLKRVNHIDERGMSHVGETLLHSGIHSI
ncbi:hypothetical protein BDN71DRAFT_1441021 [Pleurotus eryngii]|uniref:Uncharacterized protein n=1 Tax=Pleurotus eryngii TaxID=5323 RepID=A0A9P6DJ55_PLEER|nr:hypothetical protein BDN71DRAFT_1441021 [Pleurotus eryngii]